MTELNFEKAKQNRKERELALNEYDKVSKIINVLSDGGFEYKVVAKMPNSTRYQDIYPSVREFRNMLLNMRDRYDAEISRLDKEFEEL